MDRFETPGEYIAYMQEHPQLNACPIRHTINVVGGKWKIFIVLRLLLQDTMRFGELKRSIDGITSRMLSACLREMEADGIVTRKQFEEVPVRVEYSLSEKGKTLSSVLMAMANWGVVNMESERQD